MTSLVCRFPFLADVLRSARNARSIPVQQPVPAPVPDRRAQPATALEELRGEAMRRLFPKLYNWCASRRDWGIAMEVHAYLDSAASVEDLEQRIRVVERRRHFGA